MRQPTRNEIECFDNVNKALSDKLEQIIWNKIYKQEINNASENSTETIPDLPNEKGPV